MRLRILTLAAFVVTAAFTSAGTTIAYTYDKQLRLTSADYSASQTDTHVAYQYDAANNLDVYAAITDGQYLKSFLYWLSVVWPEGLEPIWWRKAKA
jgi:YD repeat-containing protein